MGVSNGNFDGGFLLLPFPPPTASGGDRAFSPLTGKVERFPPLAGARGWKKTRSFLG